MSMSQNGFPAIPAGKYTGSFPRLRRWAIPGTSLKIPMRDGSTGFILACFLLWFNERVEKIDGPVLDDWGHANRGVRGYSTTLSNHASGTAFDANALQHVLGKRGTFSDKMEKRMRKRLKRVFKNYVRWGGDYRNRADEMHFEINCTIPQAERLAKKLLKTARGRRVLKANPGCKGVIYSK